MCVCVCVCLQCGHCAAALRISAPSVRAHPEGRGGGGRGSRKHPSQGDTDRRKVGDVDRADTCAHSCLPNKRALGLRVCPRVWCCWPQQGVRTECPRSARSLKFRRYFRSLWVRCTLVYRCWSARCATAEWTASAGSLFGGNSGVWTSTRRRRQVSVEGRARGDALTTKT